jgi:hypothetical protein
MVDNYTSDEKLHKFCFLLLTEYSTMTIHNIEVLSQFPISP